MSLLCCHIVCAFLSILTALTDAQEEKTYSVSEVSEKPQPVTGLEVFHRKWSNKVSYPEEALRQKVEGMVFIQFVVNKDGSIQDASVRAGIGHGCDEAALEGFKELAKIAWIPGMKNNQPVRVKMVLPFSFRIIKM